ncbi:MAG: glycosyl hydrolase-related protein [Candidatus Sumerlaeota bacterium]|nr:glycosyl hydrolase-related protein [Candidatus Sumerlaeota bacterium]
MKTMCVPVRLVCLLALVSPPFLSIAAEAKPTVYAVGNAHIDMAWQWRFPETVEAARETFTNALRLMRDHPDYVYAQDQAALYAAIEENCPELFEEIRGAVRNGQWSVVGGKWCESTMELTSGESLARQYLYGVRYYRGRFGVSPDVDWQAEGSNYLPSVPQLLRQAGLRYAVIGRSKDFSPNRQPFYWWSGLDGSRVLTAWLASKGESGAAYNMPTAPDKVVGYAQAVADKQKVDRVLYLYGAGDHGGGPREQNLQNLADAAKTGEIALRLCKPEQCFEDLEKAGAEPPAPPFDLAQGNQGNHLTCVETKAANRRGEHALYEAEALAALAHLGGEDYPQSEIEQLWKSLLLNQFHDMMWGSTTYAVYREIQERYADTLGHAERLLTRLAGRPLRPAPAQSPASMALMNLLPFERSGLARARRVQLPGKVESVVVRDSSGNLVPSQIVAKERAGNGARFDVLFDPGKVPGIGYRRFQIEPGDQAVAAASPVRVEPHSLDNGLVHVELDPQSGHLSSIVWKEEGEGVEMLPRGAQGDRLYVEREGENATVWTWGLPWVGEPEAVDAVDSVDVVENGPLRGSIAIARHFGNSKFRQTVSLEAGSPMVRFHLETEWREPGCRLVVRSAFPYDSFRYDLPLFVGEKAPESRAGRPNILAHEWVDLMGQGVNCALLNDGRYCFDLQENAVDMAVVRSPKFLPEPDWIWQALPAAVRAGDPEYTDQGPHEARYALLPHRGDWLEARVPQAARAFNTSWQAWNDADLGRIGPENQSLVSVAPDNVFLTALKKAEDSDDLIVRVFEQAGKDTNVRIALPRAIAKAAKVTILEEPAPGELTVNGNVIEAALKAHEIATFSVSLAR